MIQRKGFTVALMCICVCFGGTVTVPTLAMDTVFQNTKLKWHVLPFFLTQLFASKFGDSCFVFFYLDTPKYSASV